MKQVVLKKEESITPDDVCITKYYGVETKGGSRGFVISDRSILDPDRLYDFYIYFPPFDGRSSGFYTSLVYYIKILLETEPSYKILQFDTMTELAKWIERK